MDFFRVEAPHFSAALRFFSGKASRKKISREKFFWEGFP